MAGTALFAAVLIGAGPAQAQTYPPGTSVPSCIPGDVNAGTVHVGDALTFTLCGNFAPGASVTVKVNGVTAAIPPKTPVNGAVTVHIKVISETVIEVDDPVNVPAVCGANTVAATGAAATGGNATVTGVFNLQCAATTTTSPPTTGGTNTTAVPGTTSTTSTTSTTAVTATTAHSGGGLAFTGANILRALLIALALLALGALLVYFQRRRRETP